MALDELELAELTSRKRKSLGTGTFAYPDQRKLPLNDASHVRNALARFNQVEGVSASEKAAAKRRIKAAAKKFGVKLDEEKLNMGRENLLLVAGPPSIYNLAEGRPMVVAKVGEWDFGSESYGEFSITQDDAEQMVENFQLQVRRQDLPIVNEEHIPAEYGLDGDPLMGPGAVGWLKDLRLDGDKVVAVPDWNAAGERLAEEDRYRAVSPEIAPNWRDPETGESHGMTLVGLALTNYPKMKGLAGQSLLAASEKASRSARVLAFAEDRPTTGKGVKYAWPEDRKGPLNTRAGVKGAVARFAAHGQDADSKAKAAAWARIVEAAKEHGVHVPDSWAKLSAAEASRYAMADVRLATPNASTDGEEQPDNDNDDEDPIEFCPDIDNEDLRRAILVGGSWTICPHDGGYMPVSRASSPMPYYYSEEEHRMGKNKPITTQPEPAAEGGADPAAPKAPAPPAAPKAPTTAVKPFSEMSDEEISQAVASMGENSNIVRMLMTEVRDGRKANAELAQRLDLSERGHKLAEVNGRIEALRDSGRITPAEFDQFTESTQVAKFTENDLALTVLEKRSAGSAVPLRQTKGADGGQTANGMDANAALDARTKALIKAAGDRGEKLPYRQAVLQASTEMHSTGYQG